MSDSHETVSQDIIIELRDKFGISAIPESIIYPEPLPGNEYAWFQLVEYLGGLQHSMQRSAFGSGFGRVMTVEQRAESGGSARQISNSLQFWANQLICPRYGIVPMEQCPRGNRTSAAGETLSDFAIAVLSEGGKHQVVSPIPMPPEGKEYWWDWYRRWKALYTEADRVRQEVFHSVRHCLAEEPKDEIPDPTKTIASLIADLLQTLRSKKSYLPIYTKAKLDKSVKFDAACIVAVYEIVRKDAVDNDFVDRRSLQGSVPEAIVRIFEDFASKELGVRD